MRFLILIGGLLLLLLACATSTAVPTIDIQRVVELTVTALSATVNAATPVPASAQPSPEMPSPIPTTQPAPMIINIPGCSLKNPQFEQGLVTKVVDGDTIDVEIDGETFAVRYIGMDAAESGEPFWREARDKNAALVEGVMVALIQDVSPRDSFERLLRYVFLADGTFVNEEMVRTGYARAMAYPPDTACEDQLNQAQQDAQQRGVGIWARALATNTPSTALSGVTILVEPSCSQFNAPGDDNNNKNEEYVCLKNPGNQAVDLTAWTIEDGYGWTYTFQHFSLDPGDLVLLHTGCGTDTAEDLFWCRTETAIWNNGGDCVHLKDTQGELIEEFCY